MNNFYIYDSEFEKELESKVNETLDLIKTERAEKRKIYDEEEELLLLDNFTKDLISQVKYLQKQFYKRYTLDDYVQRSPKTKEFIPSPAFSLTLFNSDKLMYNLYVADYYLQLHDEYLAQIEALKELSETYDIEFWEVQ